MKVVLFCGGQGTRLRDYSETIPKPLVPIGHRPIVWHLMKYYAHYGHKDFILCLGHKADAFKDYFLNYKEELSNDFILSEGGNKVELLNRDLSDWKITFVDTGLHSNIGQRLCAVKKYLEGEEVFLANYSDGLTDVDLSKMLNFFLQKNKVGCFLSVNPSQSFHLVSCSENGLVKNISPIQGSSHLMNGGFFIFKNDIFNYLQEGEELVLEPFQRLILEKELITYQYDGFWACMDTFKEKQTLDEIFSSGKAPWQVWN
jgi:glucose-1-phosphate cytidylyltransferase